MRCMEDNKAIAIAINVFFSDTFRSKAVGYLEQNDERYGLVRSAYWRSYEKLLNDVDENIREVLRRHFRCCKKISALGGTMYSLKGFAASVFQYEEQTGNEVSSINLNTEYIYNGYSRCLERAEGYCKALKHLLTQDQIELYCSYYSNYMVASRYEWVLMYIQAYECIRKIITGGDYDVLNDLPPLKDIYQEYDICEELFLE